MNISNQKNKNLSARTSDKTQKMKTASSRTNEKTICEAKKSS